MTKYCIIINERIFKHPVALYEDMAGSYAFMHNLLRPGNYKIMTFNSEEDAHNFMKKYFKKTRDYEVVEGWDVLTFYAEIALKAKYEEE